jgi:hypothetical protein
LVKEDVNMSSTAFWKTSEFKALEKEWLDKIEGEGFRDLEPRWDRDGRLNVSSLGPTKLARENSQEEFYRRASAVLHTGFTEGSYEYEVWEAFCEGLSERDLARKFNTTRAKLNKILRKGKALVQSYVEPPEEESDEFPLLVSTPRVAVSCAQPTTPPKYQV